MSAAEPLLIGERPAPAQPAAAMLPIETPIVSAALAAHDVKSELLVLAWYLQHSPRNRDAVFKSFERVQAALNEAARQYGAYSEILACEGSA